MPACTNGASANSGNRKFGVPATKSAIATIKIPAGGYTWPKMKEHIIELLSTQAITLAEFGESSGLDEYKQITKDMLKNSNE